MRGRTRRRFIAESGGVVLAGAALAAGLGRVRVVSAASQVTIGMATVPCQAPACAAVAQGYFEDEGLAPSVVAYLEVG
jgi:ABC-type nitrate/sulfonate/bicarbonate transport system substrate-binding protein